jgi:PA14 domain/LysM domain
MSNDANEANMMTRLQRRGRRLIAVALGALIALTPLAAAQPANAAAPAQRTVCRWHVVRSGDTLLELAARYNTDVLTLRRANGLRTTRIFIGQRLCIPTVVANPRPNPGTGPVTGPFTAEFWNNTSQSGAPVVLRQDAAVNFNWGFGSPDPSRIFADNFSARWQRAVNFTAGVYRFTVTADDGFRLYVDGNLVMDFFTFEGNQTRSVDVAVLQGSRPIRLDYVEKGGQALVRMTIARIGNAPGSPGTGGTWQAQFFNNTTLSGSPVYLANYNDLNFNWGVGSPAASVATDGFTARFTQIRNFAGGNYRFVAQVDDGIRVYVDDVLIINEWREQSYRTFVGDIGLSPGNHTIRVEYLEVGAQAAVRLYIEQR